MTRSAPLYNPLQAEALRAALEARHPGEDRPVHETVPPPEVSPPLDVAGVVVEQLERLPDVNNNQRRIAYYLSKGWEPAEIAVRMGCSAAYVRILGVDPRIKQLIEVFKGGTILDIAEHISASDVLDRAAIRAAELLAEKMNHALDESNQIRAAIEILKLTKHYDTDETSRVHITINRDKVEIYEKAKAEAQEGEFVVES